MTYRQWRRGTRGGRWRGFSRICNGSGALAAVFLRLKLKVSLGLHGKVISVSDERGLDGIPNGVRRVRMEIKNLSLFPHMLRCWFGGKTFTGLITGPGRMPMCLHCREVGHVRGTCPLNRPVGRGEEDLVVDDPPPHPPTPGSAGSPCGCGGPRCPGPGGPGWA